jgi:hypothetical protein
METNALSGSSLQGLSVSRDAVPSLNQVFEFGTAVVLTLAEWSDDPLFGFDRRLNRRALVA